MKNLRLVISFAFLIFMFLPLSQCSSVAEEQGPESEETVAASPPDLDRFIPIEDLEQDLTSVIFGLGSFVYPLLTCLFWPKAYRLKLVINVVQIGATCWFIYLIYVWVYAEYREPLLAGHVLFALALLFLGLSSKALMELIKSRHKIPVQGEQST